MPITIYDVASKAKVSIATVSKIINNTGRISQRTRARVLKVIDELGYRPNLVATAMASKRTFSTAILIPDISNPYYSQIIRGAEDIAHKNNYTILLCNTDNDPEKELLYVGVLKQKLVDGIIAASVSTSPTKLLQTIGDTPTCFTREILDTGLDLRTPSVVVNNYQGGYTAGKYLVDSGHRQISLISEDIGTIENYRERDRISGCVNALNERGIVLLGLEFGSGIEGGYLAMTKILSKPDKPTAVFAYNDILAVGAMRAIKEFGYAIPDDISVIGFDNTHLCTVVDPPLTSIAQPMVELGRKAMEVLIAQINGSTIPQHTVLDISLVERKSVKFLAQL